MTFFGWAEAGSTTATGVGATANTGAESTDEISGQRVTPAQKVGSKNIETLYLAPTQFYHLSAFLLLKISKESSFVI